MPKNSSRAKPKERSHPVEQDTDQVDQAEDNDKISVHTDGD